MNWKAVLGVSLLNYPGNFQGESSSKVLSEILALDSLVYVTNLLPET